MKRSLYVGIFLALRRIGLVSRATALTCVGQGDGGGAQTHATMSVIAFCRAYDIPYRHTPLKRIEHASVGASASEWEALFNLGDGERLADDPLVPAIALPTFVRRPWLWATDAIVQVRNLHAYSEQHPTAYQTAVTEFRNKYRGRKWVPGVCVLLSAHIRRGDVTVFTHPDRFTPNQRVLAVIRHHVHMNEAAGKRCVITIHSQGMHRDFKDFESEGCQIALNDNPLDTIQALISSDVLIIAKSSFSYVAGLLCQGEVLYEPFWHKPLPHWKVKSDKELDISRTEHSTH